MTNHGATRKAFFADAQTAPKSSYHTLSAILQAPSSPSRRPKNAFSVSSTLIFLSQTSPKCQHRLPRQRLAARGQHACPMSATCACRVQPHAQRCTGLGVCCYLVHSVLTLSNKVLDIVNADRAREAVKPKCLAAACCGNFKALRFNITNTLSLFKQLITHICRGVIQYG